MSAIEILKPGDVFEGRGYSDLLQEWANWLVSSTPDYQSSESVLFLRGDLDYYTEEGGRQSMESKGLLKLDQTIYKNTLVFIPVMTAMYTLNEIYEGKQLLDEASLRYAVRKDTSMSPKVWLRYETSKSTTYTKVLQNQPMKDFYFETPKFILSVKSDSPFREKFEYPLAADNYEAVAGGYCVALRILDSDRTYRFHFGGFGRGSYRTDVFYDISVLNEEAWPLSKDISSENPTPNKVASNDPRVKKFLHLKNEDEIDNISPL
jgi:hypothetical protein